MSEVSDKVYTMVRGIPKGQVMRYGEVAQQAGHPGAARAVGAMLSRSNKLEKFSLPLSEIAELPKRI